MAVAASMVMRSHEAKKNAALAAIAVSVARSKNDVLYHKLIKYRRLWKDTKNQILSKYSSVAMQRWAANQAKGK
jgi:hypothetical protein